LASYRLNASVVKGRDGGSVLPKAAYRAGEKLRCARTGEVHDFTRKSGVAHTEIILPKGTDHRLQDRETLWNAVEAFEFSKRKDAQLAREVVVSLPHELSDEERLGLTREFVKRNFVSQGMAADFAIHEPQRHKGDDLRNHHAHILLTLRRIDGRGFDPVKTRQWNSDDTLKLWRERWAKLQNDYLEQGGHNDRVDYRSLVEQREEALAKGDKVKAEILDREPEIHVGAKARKLARAGFEVDSQNLDVPIYGRRRRSSVTRTIRYADIDRGRRAEVNAERVRRRADRIDSAMKRLALREARMRSRHRYYLRQKRLWEEEIRSRKRQLTLFEKDQMWTRLMSRRRVVIDGRISLLEQMIDQLVYSAVLYRPLEQRALARHQDYQLRYLLQERRNRIQQRTLEKLLSAPKRRQNR